MPNGQSSLDDNPRPRTAVFLIAPQRTGTTVLRELLAESGLFDPFGEVFHPDKAEFYSFFFFLKEDPAARELYAFPTKENVSLLFEKWLTAFYGKSTKDYIFVDVKQNSLHHFNTIWHYPSQPPHILNLLRNRDIPIIRIKRKNLFDQAISTIVAARTGKWHIQPGESLPLNGMSFRLPKRKMEETLNGLLNDNEMIDRALSGYPRMVEFYYEEMFVENGYLRRETIRGISALLKDERILDIDPKLPLAKSMNRVSDVVENGEELIDHFKGTSFSWMVMEALQTR